MGSELSGESMLVDLIQFLIFWSGKRFNLTKI